MSLKKIALASVATLLLAGTVHAQEAEGLALFGYNESGAPVSEEPAVSFDVITLKSKHSMLKVQAYRREATAGTVTVPVVTGVEAVLLKKNSISSGLCNVVSQDPVATISEVGLFNQQAIGEDDVDAYVTITDSSTLTANPAMGEGGTLLAGVSEENTLNVDGAGTVTNKVENELLTLSNSAMNAMNSFSATNTTSFTNGGLELDAPLVNQQAVANGATFADMELSKVGTTQTSISNSAIGAINSISVTNTTTLVPVPEL